MRAERRWLEWAAFGALCLLAGSRWVVADNFPELGSTLRSEAWACGLGAVVCGAAAGVRRSAWPGFGRLLGLMVAGLGLLAMPVLGAALRGAAGEQFNRAIAMCFVPVVAVVLSGVWGEGSSPELWPGLTGLAGALLVFPFVRPSSLWGYVGLIVPPLVVGAACAGVRRVVRDVAAEWSAAALLVGGALGLVMMEAGRAASSGLEAQEFSVGAVALDAVVLGLAVFVVLRMDGVKYASRYFVVPLVMVVEGVALFRGGVTLRIGVGMVLLGVGAVGLVRRRRAFEGESSLGLSGR
jgi:hypothetical protein